MELQNFANGVQVIVYATDSGNRTRYWTSGVVIRSVKAKFWQRDFSYEVMYWNHWGRKVVGVFDRADVDYAFPSYPLHFNYTPY